MDHAGKTLLVMPRRIRCVTLLELLMVIAVISLLISMMLPSLNRIRKQSTAVSCQSNLHQNSLLVMMYANNWKGAYVNGQYHFGTYYGGDYLFGVLSWYTPKYATSGKSTRCPSNPIGDNNVNTWNSYAARMPRAATTLNTLGNVWLMGCGTGPKGPHPGMVTYNNLDYSAPILTHNRKTNMLFFDGHVLQLDLIGLKNLKDNARGGSVNGFSHAWLGEYGESPAHVNF
jgi:prepilin-type processing-associated H-X9-DG protein